MCQVPAAAVQCQQVSAVFQPQGDAFDGGVGRILQGSLIYLLLKFFFPFHRFRTIVVVVKRQIKL